MTSFLLEFKMLASLTEIAMVLHHHTSLVYLSIHFRCSSNWILVSKILTLLFCRTRHWSLKSVFFFSNPTIHYLRVRKLSFKFFRIFILRIFRFLFQCQSLEYLLKGNIFQYHKDCLLKHAQMYTTSIPRLNMRNLSFKSFTKLNLWIEL